MYVSWVDTRCHSCLNKSALCQVRYFSWIFVHFCINFDWFLINVFFSGMKKHFEQVDSLAKTVNKLFYMRIKSVLSDNVYFFLFLSYLSLTFIQYDASRSVQFKNWHFSKALCVNLSIYLQHIVFMSILLSIYLSIIYNVQVWKFTKNVFKNFERFCLARFRLRHKICTRGKLIGVGGEKKSLKIKLKSHLPQTSP